VGLSWIHVFAGMNRIIADNNWRPIIEGHGDMLDRLDWVIAAPVHFHIVRY
jgi:predicted CDP-diglyceride synthetase/phosphatidate cytidylyltransferase